VADTRWQEREEETPMASVFANGRSIVHSGDGQTNVAIAPDVCKTPTPGGPVPVPYPNLARTSDLAQGTKRVKVEGNPAGVESSNLSTSTGDEPGAAGGVVSSKTKGKMTWVNKSLNVIFEGKAVVRFGDATLHNGNTSNTCGVELGKPSLSYGADFTGPCAICGKGHDEHPKLEASESRPTGKYVQVIIEALQADYTVPFRDKIEALEAESRVYKDNEKACEKAKASDPANVAEYIKAQRIFKAKRQEANAKTAELKKAPAVATSDKPAYVVGVMMCLDHVGKVFVTASGENLAGFERVLRDIPSDALDGRSVEIVDSPGVGPELFLAKNGCADTSEKRTELVNRWKIAAEQAPKIRAPEPGQCAAQQLLAKPGHQPVAMTEAYFAPRGDSMLRIQHVRDAQGFAQATKQKLEVDWSVVPMREYGHAAQVPSCRTCQALLPFALCDRKGSC
jgi:hypothetical protein